MDGALAKKRDSPYPMSLTGSDSGGELIEELLVTHGFVMVIVKFPDSYARYDFGVTDHPRDMLFALDQIASAPPEGLDGIIDSDNVGVVGYSWEGLYSLFLSGARVDLDFYRAQYANAKPASLRPEIWWINYICNAARKWDDFAGNAGPQITSSTDGLWQPLSDPRIRAVMPMGPEGAWLFGERGLASVDRPTMIIAGTEDRSNYYDLEAVYIFDHLGTQDRSMISFIGETHFMVFEPEPVKIIKHFVTAFFGYHLRGRADIKEFFSQEYVDNFDGLFWGVYEE